MSLWSKMIYYDLNLGFIFFPSQVFQVKIIFKLTLELRNIIQSLYCIGFWDHLISKLVFKKPRQFSICPDGHAEQVVYNVYLWYLGYITLVITIYVHLFLLNRFYSSLGHPLCNLVLNKFSWISKIDSFPKPFYFFGGTILLIRASDSNQS